MPKILFFLFRLLRDAPIRSQPEGAHDHSGRQPGDAVIRLVFSVNAPLGQCYNTIYRRNL
jgi:hypothetical protein